MTFTKDTNPKDAVGIRKAPLSTVPGIFVLEMYKALGRIPSPQVLFEVGLGMLEGGRKYGRHNYRAAGVRASVYYDAALRHLFAWWSGEDIDPDSGLPHLSKFLATMAVLRDSMLNGKMFNDRPPRIRYDLPVTITQRETLEKSSNRIKRATDGLIKWWEGVAEIQEGELLVEAMAEIVLLRENEIIGDFEDDRLLQHVDADWFPPLHQKAGEIIDRIKDVKDAFTELTHPSEPLK